MGREPFLVDQYNPERMFDEFKVKFGFNNAVEVHIVISNNMDMAGLHTITS